MASAVTAIVVSKGNVRRSSTGRCQTFGNNPSAPRDDRRRPFHWHRRASSLRNIRGFRFPIGGLVAWEAGSRRDSEYNQLTKPPSYQATKLPNYQSEIVTPF